MTPFTTTKDCSSPSAEAVERSPRSALSFFLAAPSTFFRGSFMSMRAPPEKKKNTAKKKAIKRKNNYRLIHTETHQHKFHHHHQRFDRSALFAPQIRPLPPPPSSSKPQSPKLVQFGVKKDHTHARVPPHTHADPPRFPRSTPQNENADAAALLKRASQRRQPRGTNARRLLRPMGLASAAPSP